jgi:hypothetical protein
MGMSTERGSGAAAKQTCVRAGGLSASADSQMGGPCSQLTMKGESAVCMHVSGCAYTSMCLDPECLRA